jgi:PHD/YefM family antitoxin component YafN of YafNO toxin-antitoxin module
MVAVHPQYIVDEKEQRKAVILPESEWKQILDELEELDDIRAYDAATSKRQETVPFSQVVEELENDG